MRLYRSCEMVLVEVGRSDKESANRSLEIFLKALPVSKEVCKVPVDVLKMVERPGMRQ
jgi:hypothetical protein